MNKMKCNLSVFAFASLRVFWIFPMVKQHFVFRISLHPYFFRVFRVFRGSYRIRVFKSCEAKSIKQLRTSCIYPVHPLHAVQRIFGF